MRVFDVEVNFGDVYEDLIVKEASAGKLGNYTAMLCTCRLCGEDNLYKKSEVLAGKVKSSLGITVTDTLSHHQLIG